MLCRVCASEMYIDDRDKSFKGCEDIYYNCPNCITSCIVQIRFGKPFKHIWHSENNNIVQDLEYKL